MPPPTHRPVVEDDYRRTVHAADSRRAEVVDRLAQFVRRADIFEQSEEQMTLARAVAVRLTVHHPGGGSARFLVYTHHFCPEGMWFLHSGYLHPGTRCVLVISRGPDQEGGALGTIETCEHLDRNLHAASMRFESVIDPEVYRGITREAVVFTGAPHDSLALPSLHARVLMLEENPSDREMTAFHLRSLGARFSSYERLADALGELQGEIFDVVITEMCAESEHDDQPIRAIRGAGYTGPIIVLTRETDPDKLRAARRNGAFAVLQKPCQPAHLMRTLAAAVNPQTPTLPPMRDPPSPNLSHEMTTIVVRCAQRLEQLCRDILDAARTRDIAQAHAFLNSLDDQAGPTPSTDPRTLAAVLRSAVSLIHDLIRLSDAHPADDDQA